MNAFTSPAVGSTVPRWSRRGVLGLGAAALAGTVAGCSGSPAGSDFGQNTSLALPAHVDPAPVAGAISSAVPGVPSGYTEIPRPLPATTSGVPGSGKAFTTFQVNWGAPPRPKQNNRYWKELEKKLGVVYEPTLVPADAYDTKLAAMLAGGSVADLVFLHTDSANAQQAIQDGAFAELSGVLGGDKIKAYPNLANVPTYQWRASAVNNGIYGIPSDLAYVNALHVYRRDWAKKLGFSEAPRNAEEFLELMTAMAKGKPEPGRATFGFGGYSGGVAAYVNAMFRVPNQWSETGGKLTHMIESAEYADALAYTAKLWSGGAFHPDALTLADQGAKDRGLFDSGVTGWQVASADNWYLAGALRSVSTKDSQADPQLLMPIGHDGGAFTFPSSPGFYAVVAISAEAAKDPARLDEILKIMNYLRAPVASAEGFFLRYGIEGVNYTQDSKGAPQPTSDTAANADRDAMFYTGLVPVAYYYPSTEDVKNTVKYTEDVTKSSIVDPTVGLFAKSSASSSAKLGDLATDYVNAMVTGRKPLTAIESFRSDWRAQGGDQLRSELEQALQTRAGSGSTPG